MAYGNYAPFYRAGYFNQIPTVGQPMYQPIPQDNTQFAPQYQQQPQPTQQQMQAQYQVQPQQTNDMIWVQGEAGAKAYLVAPNNTVILWDSESSTIYVKSADVNGVPSMRTLDFTERTSQAPQNTKEHVCTCSDNFVSKKDFESLQGDVEELRGKVDALQIKKTKKTEVTENE